MKHAGLFAAAGAVLMGGTALAQGGEDPLAQLRACSLMEEAERLQCLEKLSRAMPAAAPSEASWVISQTKSPIDYAPIVTATISSRDLAGHSAMQFSIRCWRGQTELAVGGPAVPDSGDNYAVSYRINDGQPVQLPGSATAIARRVALKTDALAVIRSLPGNGELVLRLSPRVGQVQEASFPLAGLDTVRAKIAAPCQWPQFMAEPNK